MHDRKVVWIVGAIFAAFLPIGELMNASIRVGKFYPLGYMIPAAYIEYVGAICLGYAIGWIWDGRRPKWLRVLAIIAIAGAYTWIEVHVRLGTEVARYGRELPSSQFPRATGLALGACLCAAGKKQIQTNNSQLRSESS